MPYKRHGGLAALVLLVLGAHLQVADELSAWGIGGAGGGDTGPRRIEVAFVRELQPTLPPPVVAAPPPRRAAAPVAVAPAASSPELAREAAAKAAPEPAPEVASAAPADPPAPPPAEPVAMAPTSEPAPASAEPAAPPTPAEATAPVASAAVAAASSPAVAFDWPPSTRLTYTLRGDYRGPIDGHAQVEWLRSGERYQVHLDVSIGPTFAPIMSRRMSSDGVLGAGGLQPERYDEETRVAWRDPRRVTIRFGSERIVLADQREAPTVPGVQDSASQFVQLTWLFTLQPQRLRPGGTVELPLALPRRVGRWIYEVVGEETLVTPVGRVSTVKLQPRPEVVNPGELSVQTWFAPTLQYLPVRILIRQDEQTYIDLLLERLPQQGAGGAAAAAAVQTPNRPP